MCVEFEMKKEEQLKREEKRRHWRQRGLKEDVGDSRRGRTHNPSCFIFFRFLFYF